MKHKNLETQHAGTMYYVIDTDGNISACSTLHSAESTLDEALEIWNVDEMTIIKGIRNNFLIFCFSFLWNFNKPDEL